MHFTHLVDGEHFITVAEGRGQLHIVYSKLGDTQPQQLILPSSQFTNLAVALSQHVKSLAEVIERN